MHTQSTVLITGANKGIGLEIAKQLGQKGFFVFLGARNEHRGKLAEAELQHAGIRCRFIPMDVEREPSIQQAFEQIKEDIDRLDVLINNAAVLLDDNRGLTEVPTHDIRATLHINVLGPILTTRIFLPLLRYGSRVINVSSGAGAITGGVSGFAPIYSISKTALNAVTLQFANLLGNKNIPVNAVCPGWVRTDMGGSGATRSVEKGAETPVWLATDASLSLTGKFFRDKREIAW